MKKADSLQEYKAKRNFAVTSEPVEGGEASSDGLSFVVQKHWASRLHYDFRLELDGSMKSWAIPKGPSFDPKEKRMAVQVEDHPISYNTFEGIIPEKQYGAGKVIIWDKGIWLPIGDARKGFRDGNLKFELRGHKLHGQWVLIRMQDQGDKKPSWLLVKARDEFSRPTAQFSVVDEMPDSVSKLGNKVRHQVDNGKKSTAKAVPLTVANSPNTSTQVNSSNAKKAHLIPNGATMAALPKRLSPQLATLVTAPPSKGEWIYEIKFDGYRIVTRIDGKKIQLITRNGHDWTTKLATLAKAIADLKIPSGWLDGEIVVTDKNGLSNFQLLQNAFDTSTTQEIVYYVFDLPCYNGYDLRAVPLIERRSLLKSLIKNSSSDVVRYSEDFDAPATDLIAAACRLGLEGVIGKRHDAAYVSRRTRDWIKLKCTQRQEFVIGGFTDPKGARQGIGSLLLGVNDEDGNLLYAGNVGTGFNEKVLVDLRKKLNAVSSTRNPFSSETDMGKNTHWVKPLLVAEVSFGEWTSAGRIRHAVFHGLRTDKSANAIIREKATSSLESENAAAQLANPERPTTLPSDFKISHGERVIDQSTGLTKHDLIRFYALVAPLMMPHLKGRPVSLVRAPDGIDGQLFFQKHMETRLEGINLLNPSLDPEHAPLMEVSKPLGLLSAAQMNVIEFHTWNAVKTAIGKPDRMTFDLDPGEGVAWEIMQESTLLVGYFLDQLGLRSFVKTSGGKGMHVVVPLKKRYDWNTVKDFSHVIVTHMAATLPSRFVAKSGPKNRIGKIFIDYLRNGFGATTVAAWSVRARPGLSVSVPITWEEVEQLHSSRQWTVANIHTRLDRGNAPWDDYDNAAQNITRAMKLLDFTPPK